MAYMCFFDNHEPRSRMPLSLAHPRSSRQIRRSCDAADRPDYDYHGLEGGRTRPSFLRTAPRHRADQRVRRREPRTFAGAPDCERTRGGSNQQTILRDFASPSVCSDRLSWRRIGPNDARTVLRVEKRPPSRREPGPSPRTAIRVDLSCGERF